MRYTIYILLALVAIGCGREKSETTVTTQDTVIAVDTTEAPPPPKILKPLDVHANDRFRNVTVRKTADNQYEISGEGQIFEANFGWTVEDGHNELATGHEMTDAGAPDWGKFKFDITVDKTQENSTLTLILFETSAKDGSRVHELPIPLPQ